MTGIEQEESQMDTRGRRGGSNHVIIHFQGLRLTQIVKGSTGDGKVVLNKAAPGFRLLDGIVDIETPLVHNLTGLIGRQLRGKVDWGNQIILQGRLPGIGLKSRTEQGAWSLQGHLRHVQLTLVLVTSIVAVGQC